MLRTILENVCLDVHLTVMPITLREDAHNFVLQLLKAHTETRQIINVYMYALIYGGPKIRQIYA